MKFTEQLYRTKTRLPQPEHFIEPDGSFGVIVSCWGHESSATRAIEHAIQLKNVYSQDRQVTSPFAFIESLSYEANRLRQNIMHLNDFLYTQDNANDYKNAYEVLVFARTFQEWAWAQVGGPNIILNRNKKPYILQSSVTASTRFGLSKHPLPSQVLGLYPNTSVTCGSVRTEEKDEIVFYSGELDVKVLDENFLATVEMKNRIQLLARAQQERAFWLASLNYEGV